MVAVGEIAWNVSGDAGGVGISRFRFTRQDTADISGADCAAMATATANVINGWKPWGPTGITWTCSPVCNIYDETSGAVVPPLAGFAVPAPITGGGEGQHGAGLGVRLNWKTSQVLGRRLIKGATFLVPLSGLGFDGTGSVSSACQADVNTGAAAYLAAAVAAVCYPVIWHRPKKGTVVGGLTGIVVAGLASPVSSGLRSRRS